jgi:CRISPR-associated endoribonuclease Cas6
MRIQLHLTKNKGRVVPFNYHEKLVGVFHRWLGQNSLHDDLSLYSISWLGPGEVRSGGLDFPRGTYFSISAPNRDLLTELIDGVQSGYEVAYGMKVEAMTLYRTPDFGERNLFYTQSPVLIKRRLENGQQQFYYHYDDQAGDFLTETLQRKLRQLDISTDVRVDFDRSYPKPRIKMATYHGINNKASQCPVIIQGDPAAVACAWDVGIGNSTGIGFGALK